MLGVRYLCELVFPSIVNGARLPPHVFEKVTMEQPIARALRYPRHHKGMCGLNQLSDNHPPLGLSIVLCPYIVANTVNAKIKSVQVHGVTPITGIQDAPMCCFTDGQVQALRVRPRLAVDSVAHFERRLALVLVVSLQHENE